MEKKSLGSLPDELLLDVVEYLDTARDVAHLGALSKRTHSLVQREGWRTFVKTRFPSLDIPLNNESKWSAVADRVTYLDRCWDKRGFDVRVLQEKEAHTWKQRRRTPRAQSVSFHPVLDAGLTSDLGDEIFAAGVGENLIIRTKPQSGKGGDVWHRLLGQNHGYRPGTGDVTAVSVIERQGLPCVAVGRANGDIQILSAEDDFAQSLQNLTLEDTREPTRTSNPMRKSPGQVAVSWTEWEQQSNMLASCQGPNLALHDLSASGDASLAPIAQHDFSHGNTADGPSLIRGAKFMSKDVIACALGGNPEPLRWGKLTPTGLEFFNAANNASVFDDIDALTDVQHGFKTTVRAIEPVRGRGNQNLLLSAWNDGTYRLTDIRTPSPHDAVYRDGFQPYHTGSSLLVYGAERFIAGSNIGANLHFYDFRFPKPYYHTTALPCSTLQPYPIPASIRGNQSTTNPDWQSRWKSSQCDVQNGLRCPWHDQSRWDSWRSDATLHIGDSSSYHRVYSLCKPSDLSDTFYCGVSGGVMEMNWRLHDEMEPKERQKKPSVPPGWHDDAPAGRVTLIETGISHCQARNWGLGERGMPDLIDRFESNASPADLSETTLRHRFDWTFQRPMN